MEPVTKRESEREPTDPLSLRFVGPATGAVIEAASFDAADIAAGRVSYRDLLDAGVNHGVAERLRREYSLVWSFEWAIGDSQLLRRATRVRVFGPRERKWIASSAPGTDAEEIARLLPGNDTDFESESGNEDAVAAPSAEDGSVDAVLRDRDWPTVRPENPEREVDFAAGDSDEHAPEQCPRCGDDLVTYVLGDSESAHCEACGYTGVSTDLGGDRPAWEPAVDRLFSGK